MAPPTGSPTIDDASLPVLWERVSGHGERLKTGEDRMNRIEGKLDRLVFLQFGGLLAAAGSLIVGLIILFARHGAG